MTIESTNATITDLQLGAAQTPPSGTVNILMKTSRYYTDGTRLNKGTTYPVTADWAKTAIEQSWASYVSGSDIDNPNPRLLNGAEAGVVSISNVSDGASNLTAINALLARGGDIVIPSNLGEVTVGNIAGQSTIVLSSNSSLTVGAGTVLKSAAQRRQPFVRNKYCAFRRAASTLVRAANVVTVTDPGHMYTVGEQFMAVNGPTASFAGLITIASVAATTWTYASTGADGAAGTSSQFYDFIPIRQSLAAAAFTGATGLVIVSEPGHDKRPGQQIYMASVGNSAFAPNPGVIIQVAKVSIDNWWYYIGTANGTPAETLYLSWDSAIKIQGDGAFDGNRLGCTLPVPTGNEAMNAAAAFGCVTDLKLDCAFGGSSVRGFQTNNCDEVYLGPRWRGFDCLVAAQLEGGARTVVVDQVLKSQSTIGSSLVEVPTGQQCDDYIAFTGTKSGVGGAYDNVASPYGFTAFEDIDIRRLNTMSSLNGVKITAHSSCPFRGTFRIGKIYARFLDTLPKLTTGYAVTVFDDGPSLTSVALDVLQIDGPIEWIPAATAGGAIQLSGAGTANAVFIRGLNQVVGNSINSLYFNGMTVKLLSFAQCKFQPVNNSLQLASGTLRKLRVADSLIRVNSTTPFILFSGATVHEVELDSIQTSSGTDGAGNLLYYTAAAATQKISFKGIKADTTATSRIGALMRTGNIAMGTVDIHMSDTDFSSAQVFGSDGTGATGTVNLMLDKSVKWTASGGNNFLQVGGGLWNVFGEQGTQIPADRLALFGYGTPTYRIHMPSANATININGANYSGAQVVPVNGDIIYNNNAGAITVGLALRVLAGTWRVL